MSDQERIDEDERVMIYHRATFGKQVDNFFSSDIGRYLMARADEEVVDAIKAFRKCEPSDTVLVRKLQNDMVMAENFKNWLGEAVTDGLQALELINERNLS